MIDKKLFLGNLKSVAQEEAASQTWRMSIPLDSKPPPTAPISWPGSGGGGQDRMPRSLGPRETLQETYKTGWEDISKTHRAFASFEGSGQKIKTYILRSGQVTPQPDLKHFVIFLANLFTLLTTENHETWPQGVNH